MSSSGSQEDGILQLHRTEVTGLGTLWITSPSVSPSGCVTEQDPMRPSRSCMHAKLLQSCPTLCDPMDSSPPGSSVHGILRQEYWNGLPFPSPPSSQAQRNHQVFISGRDLLVLLPCVHSQFWQQCSQVLWGSTHLLPHCVLSEQGCQWTLLAQQCACHSN